jgi:hypothetical protein
MRNICCVCTKKETLSLVSLRLYIGLHFTRMCKTSLQDSVSAVDAGFFHV